MLYGNIKNNKIKNKKLEQENLSYKNPMTKKGAECRASF